MKRLGFLFLALMVLVAVLAVPALAEDKVFVFGRGGDSIRLDPADITDGESVNVCNQIFDGLVRYKVGTTEIEPALAESWEVSEDGMEWTFHLREGVEFHDGSPFNADAVVYTFKRQMDEDHPAHDGEFAYWGYMFGSIKDVVRIDDYTVRMVLEEPYAPFLSNMALFTVYIVSPKTMDEKGVEDFRVHPVGTGPFKFVEWKRNDRIVLEANDDYWAGRPEIDRLIFRSIPDNTTRVMALLAGEIDAMDGVDPDVVKTVRDQKRKDIKLLAAPGINVGYMAMDMEKEPFDKLEVRRAIAHAINKDKLVKEIYQGMGEPAVNILPPTLWGANGDIEDYGYDPELARELLNRAGLEDGFEFDLWYMPVPRLYMPNAKLVAQAIQQDLDKVGIKANLVTYDWGTYLEKIENYEHEACLIGWMADNGDPDNFLYVLFDKDNTIKGSAQNYSNYKNDEYHMYMKTAQYVTDQDVRSHLYRKAQAIFHKACPAVAIAHGYNMALVNDKLSGFHLYPTGNWWFRTVNIED